MKLKISGDKLTFASAHMLARHDKCARLHGHNYLVEIQIEGDLDENNMVIDFGAFKSKMAALLKRFDHKILLPDKSPDLKIEKSEMQITVTSSDGRFYRFPKEDVELLPIEATTVELLSKYIHGLIKNEVPQFKISIEIAETSTSVVIYTEDNKVNNTQIIRK